MGGEILSTDLTHIKANRHKKKLVSVEQTPKAYMEELDVDLDRKALGKKPFDQDGENHRGGGCLLYTSIRSPAARRTSSRTSWSVISPAKRKST